jgi:hypothetical protein
LPLDELDLDFMARKFKLSGGSIKNIALAAAFLAAREGCSLRMEHIIRSTRRELHKMGRVCVRSEFEQYFELLELETGVAV